MGTQGVVVERDEVGPFVDEAVDVVRIEPFEGEKDRSSWHQHGG